MVGASALVDVQKNIRKPRRLNRNSYTRVNKTSCVDETLFGLPNKIEIEANKRHSLRNPKLVVPKMQDLPDVGKNAPEEIKLVCKDYIRRIIVPRVKSSGGSLVLSASEYGRIQEASRVLNKEEKLAKIEQLKKEKEDLHNASQRRRECMEELDSKLRSAELRDKDSEVEAGLVLTKMEEMKLEEDDEMKDFNNMVNKAKVCAIRDAQLREKDEIDKIKNAEEQRLVAIMEKERQEGIQRQTAIDKAKKEQRKVFHELLINQIEENEQNTLLEKDKKDREGRRMLLEMEQMHKEDVEEMRIKRSKQMELQGILRKANEELLNIRVAEKERENQMTLQILEYMKKKSEREEAYENEQMQIRREKEKEVSRLRVRQERAQDKQAATDALRIKRNQDQAEREWRAKELKNAIRKAEMDAEISRERQRQIENQIHQCTMEIQCEKNEFERVLNVQLQNIAKDKALQERQHLANRKYAQEVRDQIYRKEEEFKILRRGHFVEGQHFDDQETERRQAMKEMKLKKIDQLREAKIPETYIAAVERMV